MVLGFMQFFDKAKKEPTNFREKIIHSVGLMRDGGPIIKFDPESYIGEMGKKLHTLRADPHNRWKAGRKIEMVYRGAGYKILDHFNKGIPELEKCVSTQKIEITDPWDLGTTGFIKIDGRIIEDPAEYMRIAQNDGFKDVLHFTKWFKKPFIGKVIHWTDLRY